MASVVPHMTNVVDIETARINRERRKLERKFNPSLADDVFSTFVIVGVIIGTAWLFTLLSGPSDFKAEFNAWLAQQEWK